MEMKEPEHSIESNLPAPHWFQQFKLQSPGAVRVAVRVVQHRVGVNGRLEKPDPLDVYVEPDLGHAVVTSGNTQEDVVAICVQSVEVRAVDSLQKDRFRF